MGVFAAFGAPSQNGAAVGSTLVEAEATSLTTYRQNIGILDVWGKPRGKKTAKGGVGGCDSDMILV